MESQIRRRLLDLNPWFHDPSSFKTEVSNRMPESFIHRDIDTTGFDNPRRAKLIVGPRQSGKSTVVWSMLARSKPESVLYLNLEEALIRQWASSAASLLADLQNEFPSVRILFFEEAQHLKNTGLVVKGLIDAGRNLQVLVTGSSSFHLMDRIRESLAGRAERRLLLPLSFGEISAHKPSSIPAVQKEQGRVVAKRMLMLGSYPDVWLSQNPERELRNLIEAYVLRDASDRFRIRRVDAFRRLLQFSAGQIGQIANYSEWSSQLEVSSSTVREYLSLLEETWIVKMLPVFAAGKRQEITRASRVHFFDLGIRNAILGVQQGDFDNHPDRGGLAEGFVFSELMKCLPSMWSLHYWKAKGGAEVDFVLTSGRRMLAIEVKAGKQRNLSRSARSFIDAYSPERFFLVEGLDPSGKADETVGQTLVCRVAMHELPEKLKAII